MRTKDIILFDKLINNTWVYDDFKENKLFSTLYPFTTENINGYMGELDLTNKKILTTGSSSDQVINAINRGCKDISLIDVNPFIRYYYELKKAALLALSYDDFFKYLMRDSKVYYMNKDLFKIKYYKILRDYLSNESLNFWDEAYNNNHHLDIRDKAFNYDEEDVDTYIRVNNYLNNEDSYYSTRDLINDININFINKDITKFTSNDIYDYMFLSNITQYTLSEYDKVSDNPYSLLSTFIKELSKYITNNGSIYFGYLYNTKKDDKFIEGQHLIYDVDKVKEFIDNIYVDEIESIIKNKKDCTLIYTKR